jgi:polar amino acid transport system substrate-binding protein
MIEEARALAPGGTLRVAINTGNRATVDLRADGELAGPAPTLARYVAERLQRPISFIRYTSAGAIMQSLADEAWDVAFLAADPARADALHFSKPYLIVEATFAVAQDSIIQLPLELDRAGIRIASAAGAAYHLHLQRTFRRATLIPASTPAESLTAFAAGGFDAVAGVRGTLNYFVTGHPQFRALVEPVLSMNQTIAIRRGHENAARVIDDLISEYRAQI